MNAEREKEEKEGGGGGGGNSSYTWVRTSKFLFDRPLPEPLLHGCLFVFIWKIGFLFFPTRNATFRIIWGGKPSPAPKDHACKVSSKFYICLAVM